ncbi:MAG: PQQ-binding-like beta-propeller repeat protein [Acidobacteriota bacterium]
MRKLRLLSSRLSCTSSARVLLAAMLWLAGSGVSASDWQQFRGPNGSGIAEGDSLPDRFDASTLRWKVSVPAGSSSPAISDKMLFLTALDGEDLITLALDRQDGREIWRQTAPRTRQEKLDSRNHPAASSPVTDGKTVVVFFGDYGLLAYDTAGKEIWRTPLGPFNNVYGTGASPILVEDRVILAVDQQLGSFVSAFDLTTGEQVWTTPRPEAKSGHSTPILYAPEGSAPQILLPGSFLLTSYDAASGEKLWWVEGLSFEMKSTAVVADGLLFIHGYGSPMNERGVEHELPEYKALLADADANGNSLLDRDEAPEGIVREWFDFVDLSTDGRLDATDWSYLGAALRSRNSLLGIRLPAAGARGDLTETHLAWQHYRNVPQLPSPLAYRDVLYIVNDRGIVTRLVPSSGEVIERGRIEGAVDSFYASPIAGDGKVFFASRSGTLAVLEAGASLESATTWDLDGRIDATPALASGTVYVRVGAEVHAYAKADETG